MKLKSMLRGGAVAAVCLTGLGLAGPHERETAGVEPQAGQAPAEVGS